MPKPPEPLDPDIEAMLLADDVSQPGWKRRLRVPPLQRAIADAPTSKHITVRVPNRLAHLCRQRANDLGITRNEYLRMMLAIDIARAYDEPIEPLLEKVPQRPGYIKPPSSAGR